MAKKVSPPLPLIGWREWVSLPDLGIDRIKVKVDTGAQTSAIHASNVEFFRRGENRWVRFDVHPYQRDKLTTIHTRALLLDQRSVRNSGGKSEHRVVIRTTLGLLDEPWPIELTLTDRDSMGFRMLLGRQAIRGRCVVDVQRSFLTRKRGARKVPKLKRGSS